MERSGWELKRGWKKRAKSTNTRDTLFPTKFSRFCIFLSRIRDYVYTTKRHKCVSVPNSKLAKSLRSTKRVWTWWQARVSHFFFSSRCSSSRLDVKMKMIFLKHQETRKLHLNDFGIKIPNGHVPFVRYSPYCLAEISMRHLNTAVYTFVYFFVLFPSTQDRASLLYTIFPSSYHFFSLIANHVFSLYNISTQESIGNVDKKLKYHQLTKQMHYFKNHFIWNMLVRKSLRGYIFVKQIIIEKQFYYLFIMFDWRFMKFSYNLRVTIVISEKKIPWQKIYCSCIQTQGVGIFF